jgi:hypothetical protein
MAGEREREVFGRNAAAVIDDADQFTAALFQVNLQSRRAGVDGVFEQFLDDARRPFDDFARGDLGDDGRGQLLDTGHTGWNSHSEAGCNWETGDRRCGAAIIAVRL